MNVAPLKVLYEDNHLLAVNKPAGLPTMGVAADQPSLLTVAKAYIKRKYEKPGNVYLGIVSRLDAPVTGVVLMARTSKAARRLTEQFRQREVVKRYWALVARSPRPGTGTWTDWLRKDERHRKVLMSDEGAPGAQQAVLSYETRPEGRSAVLVQIDLHTGRKHQIRVQFSARQRPILGDRKYGSRLAFPAGIALHARELQFTHPVQQSALHLVAPLPPSWRKYMRS
jgi:23S rRNA pseudouridine1911/1915/1917 synthase